MTMRGRVQEQALFAPLSESKKAGVQETHLQHFCGRQP